MRKVRCVCDYVEDAIKYWTEGHVYNAIKHRNGTWTIYTDYDTKGIVGDGYLCEFDEYFEEIN